MSDVKDITPDLRKLERQIDNLEEDLEPLFEDLQGMSSQLPLLDKAKLYSLTAYAIESMLFCTTWGCPPSDESYEALTLRAQQH